MKRPSQKQNFSGYGAQAIVEFAIALPILLALLVGLFEVGRMIFIYSAVTNASREASRYASAVGTDEDGLNHYNNCDGIRNMARRSAYFLNLQDGDIEIKYDSGPGTTVTTPVCDGTDKRDTGERVIVKVNAGYSPMVRLIPFGTRTFTSISKRTILGVVELPPTPGSGPGPGPGPTTAPTTAPSSTAAIIPSDTPTATATPTNTPGTGPVVTFTFPPDTATPTKMLTDIPTDTPIVAETFTPTSTPTTTPTAVPGCDSITPGQITISGTNISMTITNPHDSITVQDIQVTWNHDTGGGASNPSLSLQYITLESQYWAVNEIGPSATIIFSPTMIIPGNNVTSTITFIFNQSYQYPDTTESIVINLSTSGCETFTIQRP